MWPGSRSVVSPSAASAATISAAPPRRSGAVTAAPRSFAPPAIVSRRPFCGAVRAEGTEPRRTGEAAGEQAVIDLAGTVGGQQHGSGQGRGVGRKGRPRVGAQICPAPQRHGGVAVQRDPFPCPRDVHPGVDQKAEERVVDGRVAALNRDFAPGCGQCGGVGGGGDAVGQRAVHRAAERPPAMNCQNRRAVAGNIRPQARRKAIMSPISGSRAAPRSTVCPWAQQAAISRVSVAPTLGSLSVKSAPCSGAAAQCDGDALELDLRAHGGQPGEMNVDGARPSLHPPGSGSRTTPARQSRGAR